MSVESQSCPQSSKLTDYLLGLLPPGESESCEAHLSNCQPCVETIQGLELKDTLHDLAANAMAKQQEIGLDELPAGDSSVVGNLIHRMKGLNEANVSGFIKSGNGRGPSSMAEDRAAEIVRLLAPSLPTDGANTLGRLGEYRIEKVLGAGSSGVVFQAVDENLDRTVAIKILRPSLGVAARERFITEAKATATIDHPNVIAIYQVGASGEANSLAYIAMQLLPGETLETRLEKTSILHVEQVRNLAQQIANGLAAAHAKGLIHRDIKPANLWIVDETDQVKILDFGLVRITDEDPQLTCTGMIAGTPCYMSPEQSRGSDLDTRSDLFSLGCVAYQSLTGKLPFESSNALATLQAIQRDQPTPPATLDPAIPADVSDLTMSLLEKSPLKRPASANDVANAFVSDRSQWSFTVNQYSNASNLQTKPANPPAKPKPTAQSGMSWGGLLTTFFLIGLLGWGAFMFGPQIIRIVSNQGVIEINTNDPDVKVEIISEGEIVRVVDLKTQQSVDVKAGSYEVRPMGNANSIDVENGVVNLQRGGKSIVTITKRVAVNETPHIETPHIETPHIETPRNEPLPERSENLWPQTVNFQFDEDESRRKITLLESDIRALEERIDQFQSRLGASHPDVSQLTRQRDFLLAELKIVKTEAAEFNWQVAQAQSMEEENQTQQEIASLQQQLKATQSRVRTDLSSLEIAQLELEEYIKGEFADDMKRLIDRRKTLEQQLEALRQEHKTSNGVKDIEATQGPIQEYIVAIEEVGDKIDLLENVTSRKRRLEFEAKISNLQERLAGNEEYISACKKKLNELLPGEPLPNEPLSYEPLPAGDSPTQTSEFMPDETQLQTTAVYNGLTLDDCLKVIRSERDNALLVKPIEGVIHLVAPEDSNELIEPIMKVFRRNSFDNTLKFVTRNFLTSRTTEQQLKIMLHEIKEGTTSSQHALHGIISDEDSQLKLLPFQKEIIAAIIETSKSDDKAESVWAGKFLFSLVYQWNLSAESLDICADELLNQLESKELDFNNRNETALLLARRKPTLPGLAKQIGSLIDENGPRYDQSSGLLDAPKSDTSRRRRRRNAGCCEDVETRLISKQEQHQQRNGIAL